MLRIIHEKVKDETCSWKMEVPEATIQRCSYEKVFWKYAVSLQENTHAEVRFQ